MNAPQRYELLVLPDGAKKLTVKKDTKIPNAITLIVQREDHTLGNALRMQLFNHPAVLFAGYRMPHPLEHYFELKVQTKKDTSPLAVVREAVNALIVDMGKLHASLGTEITRLQVQRERQGGPW